MTVKLTKYTQSGKKSESVLASEHVFGQKLNQDLLYQVYKVKTSNMRGPWAHAKTRSEVRGGGRKPWAQKGLGRARHGSIRSPIWVGGGVTFGPLKTKNYKRKINKKTNKKAIAVALSAKASENDIVIIDSLQFGEPKTKFGHELLKKLKFQGLSVLIYGTEEDKDFIRVFRNIPKTTPRNINRINIVDILNNKKCIISKKALDVVNKNYADFITHIQKGAEEAGSTEKAARTGKAAAARGARGGAAKKAKK